MTDDDDVTDDGEAFVLGRIARPSRPSVRASKTISTDLLLGAAATVESMKADLDAEISRMPKHFQRRVMLFRLQQAKARRG